MNFNFENEINFINKKYVDYDIYIFFFDFSEDIMIRNFAEFIYKNIFNIIWKFYTIYVIIIEILNERIKCYEER